VDLLSTPSALVKNVESVGENFAKFPLSSATNFGSEPGTEFEMRTPCRIMMVVLVRVLSVFEEYFIVPDGGGFSF
jgi:hypothetical protein